MRPSVHRNSSTCTPIITNTFLRKYSQTEEEWLDFKGKSANDKDLKETWSKALSGFANTQGGVLIWGIDARKDSETQIDAANGLSLIDNPAAFKSRLQELHLGATDPPIQGVEIESFTNGPETDAGFVVCYIPESNNKPHRSEFLKNKPYYIRVGDSFIIPSPSLLRLLFYPRRNSHLWVEVAAKYNIIKPGNAKLNYHCRIHNNGPSSADEVFIVIQTDLRGGCDYDHNQIALCGGPNGNNAFMLKNSLHHGMTVDFLDYHCGLSKQEVLSASEINPHNGAEFHFVVHGRDISMRRYFVRFETDDLKRQRTIKAETVE